MPYATPPKCFICGKVHPCDTTDILQLANAIYVTVNVCKDHPGVQEEHDRQETLSVDEKAELAIKVCSTPEFIKMYNSYTEHLIEENPSHREFLESVNPFREKL